MSAIHFTLPSDGKVTSDKTALAVWNNYAGVLTPPPPPPPPKAPPATAIVRASQF